MRKFIEILGWLKIFASPFLTGCILAVCIYFTFKSTLALVAALIILTLGIAGGIIYANHVSAKNGSIWFISRAMASPELDDQPEK